MKHLPGLCQEGCSVLGFFNAYVCGSKLKHLAVCSVVASHFAEARICVNSVVLCLSFEKVTLKIEKEEKVNTGV